MRPKARHFLVVSHTGRQSSIDAAEEVCRQLVAAGVIPVITADEARRHPGSGPGPRPDRDPRP